MAQNVLWIRLEDKKRAYKFPIADGNMSHDLDDLAAELCKKGRLKTLTVDPSDVEFFGDYDRTQYDGDDDGDGDGAVAVAMVTAMVANLFLQHLSTTDTSPLVVRYPLSDKSIIVNVKLVNSPTEITLAYDTGAWSNLLAKTKQNYSTLQLDGTQFYYVDQATKKKNIDNAYVFEKKTKPNSEDEIVLDLTVRIEGMVDLEPCKKAYGEWSVKDVLHELLLDQHKSIDAIPELDIGIVFANFFFMNQPS
ncbi:hypothetical protein BC936DRAFT_142674 [Jimgerdemannia flammicorona]|uniref:Uncharacterized protein n=1 Tax=Jimgerdemannia flammicorona TaxID=994334 RepID=A0A433A005_9FUNG|nr:hypothetical protein BC936DRAFT_142674 [Jimgerdemannia flammicorona]